MFGEIHGRVLFIAAAKDMRESISFECEFPGTEPAFRVGVGGQPMHSVCMRSSIPSAKRAYSTRPALLQG